ncbi:MAG: hypothetical protein II951_12335 [Bacteroidales bacterium]|nr:hypothetical protein [Bacteroidales bacterium]
MIRLIFSLIALVVATTTFSQAKVTLDYYLPASTSYSKSIPAPSDILGFEVGELHASHAQVVAYFKAVAAASDRVKLVKYGESYERKPLYIAIVSTPENIANIDDIKRRHGELAEPGKARNADLSQLPVVTWLGHSIHGNEASGMNASLLLLYHLAASNDAETLRQLEKQIVIIDPSLNPDGGDRFAEWANQHWSRIPSEDQLNIDHTEAWPGGRFNHYYFDLNRDWMNLQQPESRGRNVEMLSWLPNIYTCAHEQGSNANYHFSPGAPTRVHPLIVDECQKLIGRLASDFYAPAFDKRGMLYFSGEVFDDYYIGRGREYLDFHGGIALLWEQQSSRGFYQKTDNGVLTFPLAILNQLTTELATVKGGAALRTELLSYQQKYFTSYTTPGQTYVFGSENDRASAYHFAELIRRNGIEVYTLAKEVSVGGKKFSPSNSYVVPAGQPRQRLIEGIFEIREKYADSISYDITGWTLPFSFNVDFAKAQADKGELVSVDNLPKGKVIGAEDATYAYIFEWGGYYAPRALYTLLRQGIFAKVSQSEVSISLPELPAAKKLARGSILIPVGSNYQTKTPKEISAILHKVAEENDLDIYAVSTGYTAGHNLGSSVFSPVRLPKVAIVGGNGASATAVGEIWHLFDTRYSIPLTIFSSDRISNANLSDYNVLILCGNYTFSPDVLGRLKTWVENGGVLIGIEQSLQLLKRNSLANLDFKTQRRLADVNYENLPVALRAKSVPGVILEAQLDITHPLGWGYTSTKLPIFKNNTIVLNPSSVKTATPLSLSQRPLLSGNILPSVLKSLAETPVAKVDRLGKGRVISFTIDPNFRSVWYGTNKLTANAIFFGHLISGYSLE